MATNMLNLTRVENQIILTDVSSFNLSEQLRSSVLLLEDKWTRKEIVLDLDFDEYTIFANEEMLKQVWINLIDNAVKFSPVGGIVKVSMETHGKMIAVKVSNEGDIPPESRPRVFNKFYQADESHAGEGNGIGLSVVKRIVELHEGEVMLECEGGIVSFEVCLPMKRKK
jgi:signal transduction histidine kinase